MFNIVITSLVVILIIINLLIYLNLRELCINYFTTQEIAGVESYEDYFVDKYGNVDYAQAPESQDEKDEAIEPTVSTVLFPKAFREILEDDEDTGVETLDDADNVISNWKYGSDKDE